MANPILEKTAVATEIPTPTPNKLQVVQEALVASTDRTTEAIREMQEGRVQTKAASDVIVSATTDLISANQISAKAAQTADLQAQNATIDAFEVSGGTDVQVELMSTLREDSQRVAGLLDQKQDIVDDEFTGVQLIDDIVNQFRSIQVDAELNVAAQQQDQTISTISNITSATESFARANQLTKKTLNEGVIASNQRAIVATGQIALAETKIKNINSNADAMSRLVSADARNVSNLVQAFRLEGEAEARELAKERQVLQREQMQLTRERMALELPAVKIALEQAQFNLEQSKTQGPTKIAQAEANLLAATKRAADAIATEEQLTVAVQRGQALSGLPIEERETISFGFSNPETREKYSTLQEMGGQPDMRLGLSPFEAKKNLETVAPTGNVVQTPGIKMLDTITSLQVEFYKQNPARVPTKGTAAEKEAQLKVDFNATADSFMKTAASNITTGDASNPYHSPPMGVLSNEFAAIKATPLYRKVLAAMDMKEINPEKILEAAVNGIKAKSVSPDEAAAGIEVIFDSAAAYNNTIAGGFRRVGLENQTTYNVQLKRDQSLLDQLKLVSTITQTAPLTLLKPIGDDLGITKAAIATLRNPLFILDMMNGVRVKEQIIRMMSAADIEGTNVPAATVEPIVPEGEQ